MWRPFFSCLRRGGLQLAQPLGALLKLELLDDGLELAFEHFAEGEVLRLAAEAVVRDTVLREVVGADLLRAVAATDLLAALGGELLLLLTALEFVEASPEDLERLLPIAVLRALVLALHDDAGGEMHDADGGFDLVDVLPAVSTGAEDVDAQVGFPQLDIYLLRLGQHGNAGSRSMDAPGGFGHRNALDAVDAAFELHRAVDVVATEREDDLLEAAQLGGAGIEHLQGPSLAFGEAFVDAEEVGGEECGFVPAGAGADLHDAVAPVIGIGRKQCQAHLWFERFQFCAEVFELLARKLAQFGIAFALEELRQRALFTAQVEVAPEKFSCGSMALELTPQLGSAAWIGADFGLLKLCLQLFEPLQEKLSGALQCDFHGMAA